MARRNKAWSSAIVLGVLAFIAAGAVLVVSLQAKADVAQARVVAAEESRQLQERESLMLRAQGLLSGSPIRWLVKRGVGIGKASGSSPKGRPIAKPGGFHTGWAGCDAEQAFQGIRSR